MYIYMYIYVYDNAQKVDWNSPVGDSSNHAGVFLNFISSHSEICVCRKSRAQNIIA